MVFGEFILAQALNLTPPPGVLENGVTPAIICRRGYSKRERNVPYSLKDKVYNKYGIPRGHRQGLVIDHYFAIEDGGSNNFNNLWPQNRADGHQKDLLEARIHRKICSGSITIQQGAQEMKQKWR